MARNQHHTTIGVVSFGLAVGSTSALLIFALGIVASLFGWGAGVAAALSTLFIGFGPTFVGSIAGAVWAFVAGLVTGVMVAWFYNRFLLRRQLHLK